MATYNNIIAKDTLMDTWLMAPGHWWQAQVSVAGMELVIDNKWQQAPHPLQSPFRVPRRSSGTTVLQPLEGGRVGILPSTEYLSRTRPTTLAPWV